MDIERLKQAGFTEEEIKQAGIDVKVAPADVGQVKQLSDAGFSESEILNHFQYTKQQNTMTPEPQTPQKSVGGYVGNILPDAVSTTKGFLNILRHPLQTAQGITDLGLGLVDPYINSVLPRSTDPQQLADEERRAKIAAPVQDLINRNVSDPLGIPGRIADFAYNKPVSFAMNASLGLGGVSKALELSGAVKLANAVNKASEISNPLTLPFSGVSKVRNVFAPKKTRGEALGQVLKSNAKTEKQMNTDLSKGQTAIDAIDIEGVQNYTQLNEKLINKIPEISRKVDAELLKDPTIYRIDQLSTQMKTPSGTLVQQNYVTDALTHLKQLYAKTENKLKEATIDELWTKANTTGLTKKEVNDIARLYGSEYKAFNPTTGQPLTTTNAEMFENTRKGLKGVARSGLSNQAQELDATLSSVMNTQRLIEKNAVAARKLKDIIDQRGLGEKVGRGIVNAIDVATMGTAKGAVLKILPRGLGYKVKNYLDLEQALQNNLKIITGELSKWEKVTQPLKNPAATQVPFQTQQALAPQTKEDLIHHIKGY